jgi:membrane protein DedA with SNARE-associated domain
MTALITILLKYRYLILFPLAAFEGPIVAFAAGFLISMGYLNIFAAYGIVLLGDFIPDGIYYYIGRFGHEKEYVARFGKKFGITESRFKMIEKLWHEHGFKAMFFSKLAYGLSTPFLITAGLAKVPVRKFFSYAVPITMINYALMLGLGYYFGNSYSAISKYIKGASVLIAIAGVMLFAGYFFFMRFVKKTFNETEQ